MTSQATQAAGKAIHHHHAKPSDAAATSGDGILDQITAQLKSATSTPGGTTPGGTSAAGSAQGVSGSVSQLGSSLLSTLSGLLGGGGGSGASGTSAQAASAYAASSGLGR